MQFWRQKIQALVMWITNHSTVSNKREPLISSYSLAKVIIQIIPILLYSTWREHESWNTKKKM